MILGAIFTLCCGSTSSIAAQTQEIVLTKAGEAQLDALALRVAASFKRPKGWEDSPTLLVIDFTVNSPGTSSRLGTLLADKFSERLKAVRGVEVIDRRLFKNYLKENWIKIEDISSDGFCFGIINDIGATDFVRASLAEDANQDLKISLEGSGSRSAFYDEAKFLITRDMENLLSQPVPAAFEGPRDIPPAPDVLVVDPTKPIEGFVGPQCISCPDPHYTEPARLVKLQATVELSVLVTTAGDVTSIYVLKGAPGGLTGSAVQAVKNWKMKPATKDGQPVTVRVSLEITFGLL